MPLCASEAAMAPSPRQAPQVAPKPWRPSPQHLRLATPARMQGTARTCGQRSMNALPFSFEISNNSQMSVRRARKALRVLATSPCWHRIPAVRFTSHRSCDSAVAAMALLAFGRSSGPCCGDAAGVRSPPVPSSVSWAAGGSSLKCWVLPTPVRPPHLASCTSRKKARNAKYCHGTSCCCALAMLDDGAPPRILCQSLCTCNDTQTTSSPRPSVCNCRACATVTFPSERVFRICNHSFWYNL
mmetsp:Transcript_5975/g.17275  ORF Transcript_5975/g.17275 Transcript_5975/m.17275 type:complete len:242 (-) Transcript_5975:2747-3472(-)